MHRVIEINYPNGDYYHGEVNAQDEKEGYGVFVSRDGMVYEGGFEKDKFDKKGRQTFPEG